jgi:two-component system, OmpR family, phosphate regulon sensor histidine kinase PhoR
VHPLRLLLYTSLVIAAAVAWGLGAASMKAGVAPPAAITLGVIAFTGFFLPWVSVWWWLVRRARDLDELTDRARAVAGGALDKPLAGRVDHGEIDDLARALDELRAMMLRQNAAHEEHRAAMDEIVSALGEGLLAVSPQRRIMVVNERIKRMFGIAGNVVGRSVLEVVRKQSVVNALDRALQGEPAVDRIVMGENGDERHIEIRAVPVKTTHIAAVALFIDVTEVERLQRIRRDFLDDFQHEIRTPLTGLRSATETLEEGGIDAQAEKQLRHVIQRQYTRIERLINDLAELNQIESGQVVLNRRPADLRGLLSDLSDELRSREERFVVRGEETLARVDVPRAQQIFANLLDNACKHAGGGEVVIDVGRDNGDAVVRVSDQGPGIPPAELERIFNRFYRVDRSRSKPGSGLGLAIAKHLVAAHGGSIRAFNREGGGAVFEVRLPL